MVENHYPYGRFEGPFFFSFSWGPKWGAQVILYCIVVYKYSHRQIMVRKRRTDKVVIQYLILSFHNRGTSLTSTASQNNYLYFTYFYLF